MFDPGTQDGPAGSVSLKQRASFISSQAKMFGESLYRSTIVLTYDSAHSGESVRISHKNRTHDKKQ